MQGTHESVTFKEDGVWYRRCVFCGDIKPLETEFHKNGSDASGDAAYRKDCKTCYGIRRDENKSRNKKRTTDFVGGQKRRGEDEPLFRHEDWKTVLIFFGGTCAYCGATPRKAVRLTRDHLFPTSKGGKTEPSNIVPACQSCNSSKNDQEIKDWFMKQPFFSQERLNKIFQWRTIMRQAD